MGAVAAAYPLVAQVDRLEGVAGALRDEKGGLAPGNLLASLLFLAAVFLVLWTAAWLFDRYYRRRSQGNPRRLLFTLCRAHGLRWSQWWLLRRIARYQQLEDPARLLIEPERLDPANLGPMFQAHRLAVQAIRARLFADLNEMSREHEHFGRGETMTGQASESPMPLFPAKPLPHLDVPPWRVPDKPPQQDR